jgi:aminomethyltransferase
MAREPVGLKEKDMKTTPLNQQHKQLGARMVPFGGWEMPVQYSGVIDEHLAVRQAAGLFDVSHMGEIEVKGEDALDYIQYLTINDASVLVDGQVQYSAFCYPDGGVVDDVTLYRFSAEHFMFCVNASNSDKDFTWMQKVLAESLFEKVLLTNRSQEFAQLALQGPKSQTILAGLTDADLDKLVYYHFIEAEVDGVPTIISRTGYTGEDGFELYFATDKAEAIWLKLLETGAKDGLLPIGLGARDTLRLEKKYALYGHELSESITPLEGGIGWITKLGKANFVGQAALRAMKEKGVPRRLVAIKICDKGIPREEYPVFVDDHEVGVVTSGTMSPQLKVGIALALVDTSVASVGSKVEIGIRQRRVAAEIIKPPFV